MDTDHDGLCDDTEADERSDPRNPDTDGDGLLDSFEYILGANPLSTTDPPASVRFSLDESPDTVVTSEQILDYRPVGGEVVSATVLDGVRGVDGLALSEFTTSVVQAIAADPPNAVASLDENRFVGVTNRVRLDWRASVRWSSAGVRPLGCRRPYTLRFTAKREGDEVVAAKTLVIMVGPAEGTPAQDAGTSRWPAVTPDGLCLPRYECF